MITHVSEAPSRLAAPALRFLGICLGGWVVLRIMMVWNPLPPTLPAAFRPPWVPAPSGTVHQRSGAISHVLVAGGAAVALSRSAAVRWPLSPTMVLPEGRGVAVPGAEGGSEPDLRVAGLALSAHIPSSTTVESGQAGAMPHMGGGAIVPGTAAEDAMPGRGKPLWEQRNMAGWSLGGWLYLRDASVAAPGGIAAVSQLGASQGGMRIAYGFGKTGRLRADSRTTAAVRQPQRREQAFGLAFAPASRWPVDIAVEQRVKVGREGRTALAAMVTGGVSGVALPGDFRLDAYGQAGVVGARHRDGFADGAVVIDRRLGRDEAARLRLGLFAAGAVQPGAARVDVGPRLTLRLPHVGEGSRIALEWRHRIAGDAMPESGVALTLAAAF